MHTDLTKAQFTNPRPAPSACRVIAESLLVYAVCALMMGIGVWLLVEASRL